MFPIFFQRAWQPAFIFLSIIALVALQLTLSAKPAAAHGEGRTLQLAETPIGAYAVTVWTSPGYLRTGEVHFSTAILDADRKPVTDCIVQLSIVPFDMEGDPILLVAQGATPATLFEYEMALDIQKSGRYQVDLLIRDGVEIVGTTTFDLEITGVPFFIQLQLLFSSLVVLAAVSMLIYRGLILSGWRPSQVQSN